MFSKLTRVSPAMGVACIAVVLSLGGTSFAQDAVQRAGKLISGSQIKRASLPGDRLVKGNVTGDRLKADSVTGRQIDEKTLGTVPSAAKVTLAERATNAQRATNADNALALGGTAAAGYLTYSSRTIPPGTTVTGAFGLSSNPTGATANDITQVVQLPGLATTDLTDGTVNFGAGAGAADADPACTGSAAAPTAPGGRVCLYLSATQGAGTSVDGAAIPLLPGSRSGFVVHAATAGGASTGVFGVWAYTAP